MTSSISARREARRRSFSRSSPVEWARPPRIFSAYDQSASPSRDRFLRSSMLVQFSRGVYWKRKYSKGFRSGIGVQILGGYMDKNGLSAFLLGLGVGVGIGMLFAPKSGQETRDMLRTKAGEGTDYLKQRSTEIKQTASEWVDKGKDTLSRQKDTIADAVQAGRQAYRDAVNPQSEGLAQ